MAEAQESPTVRQTAQKKRRPSLQQQANIILREAEKRGVSSNYFFLTTFKRYQMQMKILEELEKEITKEGAMVTKEYVKGRANIYTNPAIGEYNKTATAANGTVATLINIVKQLSEEETGGQSKLAALLEGLTADE